MQTTTMPVYTLVGVAPALPWSASISLEDYATLCAEVTVFPARTAAIYGQRSIATPEQASLLHQQFMSRFRQDPALHQRWTELVAATTARLRLLATAR
jgi:hypothetical protein